ncbi:MAG: S8 family serine peptidase [Thiotrichales bacterium]|nr:S8 family serine peptidase [Thiotrichales bacterium]
MLKCRHFYYTLLTISFSVLFIACASTSDGASTAIPQLENTENVMMVVIDDPRSERRKRGLSGPGYSARLDYKDDPLLHKKATEIADDHGLIILLEWPLRNLNVHCFAIKRPSANVLTALKNDARVRWVQPFNDFIVKTSHTTITSKISPTKQFFNDISERGNDIDIAVIDTSADISHPDLLLSRIIESNFVGNRGLPSKELHGTAVVGLIAAKPNSPDGIAGLANEANVHLLRGCWQNSKGQGVCNTLTLALAFDAAIDLQPDVLNLSLTGPYDKVLNELLVVLLKKNTLVVAAYDENRGAKERFPLQQPGVIYAYGTDDESQQPVADDILYAPKHAVSLTPMAGYELVSGHSIATPHIAAMAACLMNRNPNASRQQIIADLKNRLS